MSELSNVIEARLHGAEIAAGNAQTSANSALATIGGATSNLTVGPTAPASPAFGQIWSDTSAGGVIQVKVYDGGNWIQINPV